MTGKPALRATALTVFLGVLLVVMAGYTLMAMEMQWRTAAGRIGPGFFPRIIGFAAIALCVIAAVQSLRPGKEDDATSARHPKVLLVFVGAGVVFLLALLPLGAVVASAIFLLATLSLLDQGHLIRNIVIAVLLPVGLYLLFDVALNAGLPSGVLPGF
ncbi:tripartite tricarboxylate transporter TctB family protein [Saccharopolyspora sp. K220]|uniref:tripartite tricarboxylate transporter TctB family protein n=1 Tax=Saccharopolyspora soli TaxID=2926618 RepID=UPI001F57DC1C|nr:tripartite tricarboxylate transporter TctB family protein [Saccharopolyspora soli]MCI2416893.1 tripartite tricarboxylate transporter TctB family protein [Saccharopolyspora soli]